MNRRVGICAVIFLSLASGAIASTSKASPDETRLIGAWQEGLAQGLVPGAAEQRAKARKTGVAGAITVFKADHSFELHPPCGPKQEDLRRLGLQSVPGTWQLSDAGELTVTIGYGQRKIVTQGKLQWREGRMVWVGKDGRLLQRPAEKYDGPLPMTC